MSCFSGCFSSSVSTVSVETVSSVLYCFNSGSFLVSENNFSVLSVLSVSDRTDTSLSSLVSCFSFCFSSTVLSVLPVSDRTDKNASA